MLGHNAGANNCKQTACKIVLNSKFKTYKVPAADPEFRNLLLDMRRGPRATRIFALKSKLLRQREHQIQIL